MGVREKTHVSFQQNLVINVGILIKMPDTPADTHMRVGSAVEAAVQAARPQGWGSAVQRPAMSCDVLGVSQQGGPKREEAHSES